MAQLTRLTLDDVAPDLRARVTRFPRIALDRPVLGWILLRIVRALQPLMRAKPVPGIRITTVRAASAIRIHRPDDHRSPAALFWIHGGGYILGSPKQDDAHCGHVAAALGITVIAPAYRFAPEHAFPAPLDDLHAAWFWLLDQAGTLGIDPARIVIGGESAGGGLAAALVQRIHDEGGIQPIGQWLFCPMLDDRTAARRELDAARQFVWDNPLNAFGWRSYLGTEPGAPTAPAYAAPARREVLSGLPPAWIGVGSIDLFRDEDAAYAGRLKDAGVAMRFYEAPGGPHAFNKIAPEAAISRAFDADALDWLKASFAE